MDDDNHRCAPRITVGKHGTCCAVDRENDHTPVTPTEPTAEFMPAIEHGEIFTRSLGINVRIFADVVSAERWVRFGTADD